MHRPHPTKLECASAFDPIRDLARDLDAQIDERVPQLALRQILHQKLAPVGDSRCLEGWTWKELKDRDVSAAAESLLATVRRERAIPTCSSSSVSAKKYPCVNLHRRYVPRRCGVAGNFPADRRWTPSQGTPAPAPATPKKKREAVVLESDDDEDGDEDGDEDAASDDDVATAGGTPGKKKNTKRRRR